MWSSKVIAMVETRLNRRRVAAPTRPPAVVQPGAAPPATTTAAPWPAASAGAPTAVPSAALAAASPATAHVGLSRRPRIAGTVTDSDGEPLRGIHVKVMSGDRVVAWEETDGNGRYEVAVPIGTYEVEFYSTPYRQLTDYRVVAAATVIPLDAELTLIF